MQCYQQRLRFVSLVTLTACVTAATAPVASGISADPTKHWTADNGNGTYSNPLFYEEFEDPDIIRVGEDYYLVGTTMHMNPALQIMHSKDLVNWELAGICQRPPGPESIMTVELDTAGMVTGDTADLALLSSPYAWIGVVKSAEGTTLQMYISPDRGPGFRRGDAAPIRANPPVISPDALPKRLWLRVHCNFETDQAVFSSSADGKEFTPPGGPFTMTFQLRTFQGVRPSLFHYNTSGQPGGHVDFDSYTVEEPRARSIEREIPLGKTIVLTSGADGSFLVADLESLTLVNVPAADQDPANAKFQVIDLGKGRVALKANDGKVASVTNDGVVLKDIGNARPGNAESRTARNSLSYVASSSEPHAGVSIPSDPSTWTSVTRWLTGNGGGNSLAVAGHCCGADGLAIHLGQKKRARALRH